MQFNTSKNKLNKIENNQEEIDNNLFNKNNEIKILKSSETFLKHPITLFNSDYQVFTSNRIFGGLISVPISMPIVADFSFVGNINITETMIPYIQYSIITKKPIKGDVRGLYIANISSLDADPSFTQSGFFKENVNIFNSIGQIIGNTGNDPAFTNDTGDITVIRTHLPLDIIDQQRNIHSTDDTQSLQWNKVSENNYDFNISGSVMLIIPSEENVGTTNLEGDQVYNATVVDEVIQDYVLTDNRISVAYPAYRPIEEDIEIKLILSIIPHNLWENYFNTTL